MHIMLIIPKNALKIRYKCLNIITQFLEIVYRKEIMWINFKVPLMRGTVLSMEAG